MTDSSAIDTVRDIVDVAVSVLYDYGPSDPDHQTRIERMARWIALNLAVEVHDQRSGAISRIGAEGLPLVTYQIGEHIAVHVGGENAIRPLNVENARQLATALYICVERAEGE